MCQSGHKHQPYRESLEGREPRSNWASTEMAWAISHHPHVGTAHARDEHNATTRSKVHPPHLPPPTQRAVPDPQGDALSLHHPPHLSQNALSDSGGKFSRYPKTWHGRYSLLQLHDPYTHTQTHTPSAHGGNSGWR